MTTIAIATDIPSNINTLERLIVHTVPFGRQSASSLEFATQNAIASNQQTNYIITFTPERLRQR
jgi:hypothetical protein